jgi:undecaprenyl-diphosphatase
VINEIKNLDHSFFLFLNSLHSTSLNPIMVFFSGQVIWLPLLGYFLWYSMKVNGRRGTLLFGLFLFLSIIASDVTSSYILKNIFERLRPCRQIEFISHIYSFGQKCGGKYGFVSSHAANSVAVIIFSLRVLPFHRINYALCSIPVIVGFSRIYLGVHFPADILGGMMVGFIWAYLMSYFFKEAQGASRNISH